MEHVTDHSARALARVAEQLREQPKFAALLSIFSAEVQALEDAVYQVFSERGLEAAEGVQLELLGRLVGQARGAGVLDADYRAHLLARIRVNRSNGSIPEMVGVLDELLPPSSTILLDEGGQTPAGFVVRLGGTPHTLALVKFIAGFFRAARMGGVRAILEWFEADPDDVFTLDGTADQSLDVGRFSGAIE